MDAVAAGVGADEHEDVAGAFRLRAGELVDRGDADAHGVDERVAGVGVLEDDLAADGGDAEAVAVAADAGDDAAEEVAVARRSVESAAEAKRESRRAIGRAPIAKMSRTMPPTPVAAPW